LDGYVNENLKLIKKIGSIPIAVQPTNAMHLRGE